MKTTPGTGIAFSEAQIAETREFREVAKEILDFSIAENFKGSESNPKLLETEMRLRRYLEQIEFALHARLEYAWPGELTRHVQNELRPLATLLKTLHSIQSQGVLHARAGEAQQIAAQIFEKLPQAMEHLRGIVLKTMMFKPGFDLLVNSSIAGHREMVGSMQDLVDKIADDAQKRIGALNEEYAAKFAEYEARVRASEADFQSRSAKYSEETTAVEVLRNKLSSDRTDLLAVLEAGRKQVGDKAVAAEESVFDEAAGRHFKWFCGWLALGLFALCGLSIFTWKFFFSDSWTEQIGATAGQVMQRAIPRIVFFILGSAIVAWCLRAAAAERHNQIVNKHRSHALKTFQTFVATVTSPQIREAILMRATDAVFAPQSTGFQKDESGMGESSRVVELVRDFSRPSAKDGN